jgi:hypothetical protein
VSESLEETFYFQLASHHQWKLEFLWDFVANKDWDAVSAGFIMQKRDAFFHKNKNRRHLFLFLSNETGSGPDQQKSFTLKICENLRSSSRFYRTNIKKFFCPWSVNFFDQGLIGTEGVSVKRKKEKLYKSRWSFFLHGPEVDRIKSQIKAHLASQRFCLLILKSSS